MEKRTVNKEIYVKKIVVMALMVVMMVAGFCEGQKESQQGGAAQADSWPAKAVNIIVPASAGGGTDLNARVVAKHLAKALGQPVTITNIKGGSGSIGYTEAKNSAPDGYTYVYTTEDIVTNHGLGLMDFGYDAFEPVSGCISMDMFWVMSGKYGDVPAFTSAAKANPGTVSYAGESGAFISILPYVVEKKLGVDLKIVDGGQMAERLPLMVGGHIAATYAPYSIVKDYVDTGKLTAVNLSTERSSICPDIPTAREQGLDIVRDRFQYLLAPKGTDSAIIKKISDAMATVSKDPAYLQDVKNINAKVAYMDPAGIEEYLSNYKKELEVYFTYLPKR